MEQLKRVQEFRREIETQRSALFKTYSGPEEFESVLRQDLDTWFNAEDRPWARTPIEVPVKPGDHPPANEYFQNLVWAYQWLDIAGIDSDRAFKLPLDQIYVRLRVVSGEDDESGDSAEDATALRIQEALERYRRLVIVGDPGSGKSTFLRFIALTLAQCSLSGDEQRAVDQLSLNTPLPIPIFLSCWDLSEHLVKLDRGSLDIVLDFALNRIQEAGWPVDRKTFEQALDEGSCILLVDGLDEVPTDEGRQLIKELIEELVDRYPRSRYVVTSRIRAYTGATVLGQQFARCDIQPFSKEERTAFLHNWVKQLFRVRSQDDSGGREAIAELNALSEAIEASSIRSLAVNPLLLTVIAIVHWNRKRLPEQRVDLYDECIDVLLGQRKEAEQQRTSRDTRVLDEQYTEERLDQRIWVRKRFAEIAYNILSRSDEEEIDQAAVINLLEPHFRTSEGDNSELKAQRFLDRQELRSGLFVRRRGSSYRFVHLTFQEYLAAWYLANRDIKWTLEAVTLHIREARWFETLQLLGGALANRSDEYLDQYVLWLLDHAGVAIREQAPVIALVANIVRDTQAVAGLSTDTRGRYESLLRETLHAFAPSSRIPKQTQLDLLEALAGLGASVKDHLISATGSRLLDVRRRALEILVPHLSDDDLFSMTHILGDRSKEPVKTYISAIVERDRVRAGQVVLRTSLHGEKTLDALSESPSPKLPPAGLETWPRLVGRFANRFSESYGIGVLRAWEDYRDDTRQLIKRLAAAGSAEAMEVLVQRWGDQEDTWELVRDLDKDAVSRLMTSEPRYPRWPSQLPPRLSVDTALLERWGNQEDSWELVRHLADAGSFRAMEALLKRWGDREDSWELIKRLAKAGSVPAMRVLALQGSDREGTWGFIESLAKAGSAPAVQVLSHEGKDRGDSFEVIRGLAEAGSPAAVRVLAQQWRDREDTWELVRRLAEAGSADAIRILLNRRPNRKDTFELIQRLAKTGSARALQTFAEHSEREDAWELVRNLDEAAIRRLANASEAFARWYTEFVPQSNNVVEALLERWGSHEETWDLVKRLAEAGSALAMRILVGRRGDREETWELIRRLAEAGSAPATRVLALQGADREHSWDLIKRQAAAGSADALEVLVERRGHRKGTWELVKDLSEDAVSRLTSTEPISSSLWNWSFALRAPRVVYILRQQWRNRQESWQLISRLAEAGSSQALQALVRGRGNREDTWQLVERLAEQGSPAAAGPLVAWRDWAYKTAGPAGVKDLFASL